MTSTSTAMIARTSTPASTWVIDAAHTTLQFSIKHMMVATVRGHFGTLEGTVELHEDDPTRSSIEVDIDASSIDTREPARDAHLRSADFFDVEHHPRIRFQSTSIERRGATFMVTGDLTIRGVTHPVVLTAELTPALKNPWGNLVRGVSAKGTIDRKAWGLTWNSVLEAGGLLVGDEVKLQIDAELNPAT